MDTMKLEQLLNNSICEYLQGIREFRKNCSAFETPKVGKKTIKIVLPEDEFVYGVPNR